MTDEHTSPIYEAAQQWAAEREAEELARLQLSDKWKSLSREDLRVIQQEESEAKRLAANARHKLQTALYNALNGRRPCTPAQAVALAPFLESYEAQIKALKRQVSDLEIELSIKRDREGRIIDDFNDIWRALESIGLEFFHGSKGHGYRVLIDKKEVRNIEKYETIKEVIIAALTWWKEYEGIPF